MCYYFFMNLTDLYDYNYMKGVNVLKQTDINRLVTLHGKKLYNFCLRLCKNTHDADDLYQDTFLKAMEKTSLIDEDNNPSAYLCTIAVSLWKSAIRKDIRRHEIAPTVPIETKLNSKGDQSVEEEILKSELSEEIKREVSMLNDNLRPCVLLHYIGEMGLSEIAKVLKIPEGTVKSRLFTARKILKEKIGENL